VVAVDVFEQTLEGLQRHLLHRNFIAAF
jgi:hypothetical protein